MSKKDMKKEAVILRVRNLHIHLDEHMETTNHFEKEDTPCCCGCQGEDVEIDLDELAAEIAGEAGSAAQEEHMAQESRKPEGSASDFLENEFPEMLGQLLGGAILMGIMESVLPEGMRPGKKSETGGLGHGKDRK